MEGDGTLRAFFAVELGEPARRAAAEVVRRLARAPGGDGVRWVRPEALHVTLRFLGDVAAPQAEPLARRAAGELAALAPFPMRLGPAALFPSPRRPRVVALALEPEAPLAALAEALERAAVAQGFAPEPRPFRAHLTLGRVRERRFPAVSGVAVPAEETAVSEAVLFRSELRPEGSRYTPLFRVPLGNAPGAAAKHHPEAQD